MKRFLQSGTWNTFWNKASVWKKRWVYLGVFSVLFLITYFVAFEVMISGNRSYVWYYDGLKQHYTAFTYIGQYIREIARNFLHGEFVIPMFDFQIGMGEDIITTLNFYGLGEPLTLLSALFPASMSEAVYNFLVIFRPYLAGLSFSVFAVSMGRRYSHTLIASLVYAFSGYALHVCVKHPFFIIPMICLPLLILGLERIIQKKYGLLFPTMVFITAINGFYFFYMVTIVLVIYAVIRVLVCSDKGARLKETGRVFVRCVVNYAAALLLAAFVFLPSIVGYLSSSRSDSVVNTGNLLFYDVERLSRIFLRISAPPYITWDFVGIAAIAVLGIVLLYTKKNKVFKTLRIGTAVCGIMILIPFSGYMMNGFSYVSGRWLFVAAFVFSTVLAYVLPSLLSIERKGKVACGAVILLLTGLYFSGDKLDMQELAGLFMLTLSFVIVLLIQGAKQQRAWLCILLLVIINIGVNGTFLFDKNQLGYENQFIEAGSAYEKVTENPARFTPNRKENEFYRVDASASSTENASMLTGDYGVSCYFSIVNAARLDFLNTVENGGTQDSMFKVSGIDNRTELETLSGVRYYVAELGEEAKVPYGFEEISRVKKKKKTYVVYENKYALSIGVTYDSYLTETDCENLNGVGWQELAGKAVILENENTELPKTEKRNSVVLQDYQIADSKNVKVHGNTIKVTDYYGSITLKYGGLKNAETYVRLAGLKWKDEKITSTQIVAQSEDVSKTMTAVADTWNWYFGRDTYLFNLGYSNKENDSCTITFQRPGEYTFDSIEVVCQPMETYAKDMETLRSESLENVKVTDNQVTGEITASKTKMLVFSIPYSKGWSVTVDGKEEELVRANGMFMGTLVGAGKHDVKLNYVTPYFREGVCLSFVGVAAFILIGVWNRKAKRR